METTRHDAGRVTTGEHKRLGRNSGGYFGETIDLPAVLRDCERAAREHGWRTEEMPASPGLRLFAFVRPAVSPHAPSSVRRIYLSTGIHGDEPAGPLAARQLLHDNAWPAPAELRLVPCLNPAGFARNQRGNAAGLDLNRDYRHGRSAEVRAHLAWLEQQPPFDLCLCLHEDWEANGFYVYELNPDGRPSLAERMVAAVARVCPIDLAEMIEGRPARGGIIRPTITPSERPEWPEAFYLIAHRTRLSYTLEAPSDFPLPVRVAALVAGVKAALAGVGESSPG